jgi:hypothetical protein
MQRYTVFGAPTLAHWKLSARKDIGENLKNTGASLLNRSKDGTEGCRARLQKAVKSTGPRREFGY